MKRALSVFSGIGAVALVCAVVFVCFSLSNKQGQLNDKANTLHLSLLATEDEYAKCYNSINRGSYMINDVIISHLSYTSTDAEKANLDQIGSDFSDAVKKQCEPKVKAYEKNYSLLSATIAESNNKWWIRYFIGGDQVSSGDLTSLDPTFVRNNAGDPLTDFIFTKADVEQYFENHL